MCLNWDRTWTLGFGFKGTTKKKRSELEGPLEKLCSLGVYMGTYDG